MKTLFDSRAVFLAAAVQFVYLLDFLMVMPLGPDLAQALGFDVAHLGMVAAAYTLSAVAAGLVVASRLDRLERRGALVVGLALFSAATLITALAVDFATLVAARMATGLVGGPTLALALAILVDDTPPERRGRAMAQMMTGFTLAVVAGVPAALELGAAHWRAPFLAAGGLALLLALWARSALPRFVGHLGRDVVSPRALLGRGAVRRALGVQAGNQFAAFLVVPYFSAFLLLNAGLPRDDLGLLYFVGGFAAWATVQAVHRSPRPPSPRALVAASVALFVAGVFPFWGGAVGGFSALLAVFMLFMLGNALRNVSVGALCSQVPAPHERAAYLSIQNIVQDAAVSAAALVAGLLVFTRADGALGNTGALATLALAALAVTVVAVWRWRST